MSSSHGNSHSDAAKLEQIITEFFAKSLQIILESRSPCMSSRNYSGEQALSSPASSSSSSSSVRPRDKWFNLALRECPAALENIDLWRQSNHEPMVVDVILVQTTHESDQVKNFFPKNNLSRNLSLKEKYPFCSNSDQEELGFEGKSEKIIERWVIQYENRKIRDGSSSSSSSSSPGSRRSSNSSLHVLYKKSILLLRSLYVTIRLLPAYKIYRELNSSGKILPCSLTHRVSSFVEPFTRREESELQRFGFAPVDTPSGRLCLSVLYCSSLSDVSSEPSTPMSPQVIHDYVGSPLADQLKRFPSLPVTGYVASHGSPPSSPFIRRHSWSYDTFRPSPPSASYSPSPTHWEARASISNPGSRRFPPGSLPPQPPETSLLHKKDTSFDEYCPSPIFSPSPSPSPSPPICIPGSHLSRAILRSESAPVNIPSAKFANGPTISNKQNVPPSPPHKTARSNTSRTDKAMGSIQTGTIEKSFSLGKEENRQHSGLKISSNSSPRISLSRSSSRSFPDDFDDSEFACPFDVDYDDVTNPGSRTESFEQKGPLRENLEARGSLAIGKSQDAAVGALVLMLRKAPPLCQDFSDSGSLSQALRPDTWSNNIQENNQISEEVAPVQHVASSSVMSSGLSMSKTTADALEELQGYREMRNLLLKQSGKSHM